jgi:hypothetical protein
MGRGLGWVLLAALVGACSPGSGTVDGGLPQVGTLCVPPTPPAPACGVALCGNGKVDGCPTYDQFMPVVAEQCDGLASIAGTGETCAGLGFAGGGTLACTAQCYLDTSRCERCSQGSPHVVRCTTLRTLPGAFSLATTDDEIMVARVYPSGDGTAVRLVRYAADLSVAWMSGCFGPANAASVAIARSPSGYVLAVGTRQPSSLQIYPLAPDGAVRGPVRTVAIQTGTQYVPPAHPFLASRMVGGGPPLGGPLLVYTAPVPYAPVGSTGETRVVALLRDDGSNETSEAAIPDVTFTYSDRGSGVFVGDGFLYAQEQSVSPQGAALWHIGLDGTLGPAQTPAVGTGSIAEYPSLAWTGTAAYFTYVSADPMGSSSPYAACIRLTSAGAQLGPPTPLSGTFYQPAASVALGEDLLVLAVGKSAAANVYGQRVSNGGGLVEPPFAVAIDDLRTLPEYYEPRLALLGRVPIAAWPDGLAKLSP